MLKGLVKAGFKETIKDLARKAGYKPATQSFFEVLGWKQKQSEGGHRTVGLGTLKLDKQERFDGLSEAEICEAIETQRLSYKDVVGRLPKDTGPDARHHGRGVPDACPIATCASSPPRWRSWA